MRTDFQIGCDGISRGEKERMELKADDTPVLVPFPSRSWFQHKPKSQVFCGEVGSPRFRSVS